MAADRTVETMTTRELAERWQMSEPSVLRLAKAGRIPGTFRSGRRYLFSVEKIKAIEEEGGLE